MEKWLNGKKTTVSTCPTFNCFWGMGCRKANQFLGYAGLFALAPSWRTNLWKK